MGRLERCWRRLGCEMLGKLEKGGVTYDDVGGSAGGIGKGFVTYDVCWASARQ